jgi:hypothetical protein
MNATAVKSTLNVAAVKAFYTSHKTRDLVLAVVMAKAHAKEVRAKVDAYIAPVFAACGPFPVSRDMEEHGVGCRVVDKPSNLYQCRDEAKCAAFYAACDAAHKANGYDLPAGYCPALVAEHAIIDAEHALLDAAIDAGIIPDGVKTSPKLRDKALTLLINPPKG